MPALTSGLGGSGFRVQGFGFGVQSLGFRVRVQGVGFRLQGLGFRVQGWLRHEDSGGYAKDHDPKVQLKPRALNRKA